MIDGLLSFYPNFEQNRHPMSNTLAVSRILPPGRHEV